MLAPETHDLVITSETREDADADTPDGVVVWVNATTTDKATGGNFQLSTERVAFDEADGDGVDCDTCDTWIAESDGETVEEVPTTFEGQIYKFPFDAERKSYDVWDGPTGEAVPATYEGEESIQGLDVYKFVQVIEPTVIETREIPGSVFGEEEAVQVQELVSDGERVPAFVGTIHYTDAQVDENVDDVATRAMLLGGTQVLYPAILLLLGLLSLGVGLILNRRLSSDADDHAQQDRPLVTA